VIVADTNTVAYFIIPGDRTEQALAAFQKDSDWIAPLLWRSEFRNVLAVSLHNNYISIQQAIEYMEKAEHLMNGIGYAVNSSRVLNLALTSGCTAYDCEFVALAQDLGIPLVTSDQKLLETFPAETVSMDEFVTRT